MRIFHLDISCSHEAEELINIDYDENLGTKITRLATHLRAAISSTDPAVVTCAAHAIGTFA